jgi:uncharacterized GH25 family protein
MTVQFRAVAVSAVMVVLAPAVAQAHDFWIEPALYRVPAKSTIDVRLCVGVNFEGKPVERKADRVVRFEALGPGGGRPIMGDDGAEPAGTVELDKPGLYILVHQNSHARIELEAVKFEEYLKEEGLDAIIRERAARGQSKHGAREVYARYAKSLVCVGENPSGEDRPTGLPLELVLESKPCALRAGDRLVVLLLLEGKPLPGIQLTALNRGAPNKRIVTRTDKSGRATFMLADGGVWMIAGVHMRPAARTLEADWESFWASITFEIAAPPTP